MMWVTVKGMCPVQPLLSVQPHVWLSGRVHIKVWLTLLTPLPHVPAPGSFLPQAMSTSTLAKERLPLFAWPHGLRATSA